MACHVVSCHGMSWHVMSFCVVSYHIMLYYFMSCHVVLCRVIISCYITSCHVMSFCVVSSYHVILLHVMSCHVVSSYNVILLHVMSCYVITYRIIWWHVIVWQIMLCYVILILNELLFCHIYCTTNMQSITTLHDSYPLLTILPHVLPSYYHSWSISRYLLLRCHLLTRSHTMRRLWMFVSNSDLKFFINNDLISILIFDIYFKCKYLFYFAYLRFAYNNLKCLYNIVFSSQL